MNQELEKAGRPSNPNLILTHVIDKNGHHRIVWKSREELKEDDGEKKKEVEVGESVWWNGEEFKVVKDTKDGYLTVENSEGKKYYKSIRKLTFKNPESGEKNETAVVKTTTKQNKEEKEAEKEAQESLDYDTHGTPAERMEDWVHMINGFAGDTSKNLTIAYGTGGVGKTFNVLRNKTIKDGIDNGDIVKFTGGTTTAGFLEMLYENRDKKIILDDFDMIFKDPQMLGILSTLSRSSEERIVKNPSSDSRSGGIPSKFEFTGKIMVISNIDIEKEAQNNRGSADKYEDLLVNSNNVNLYMTKKETWDLIDEFILHKEGEINEGLNFQDAYGGKRDVTTQDREELAEYFKQNWRNTKELSGRTLSKAAAIQQFYKEKGGDWMKKADQMLLESPEDLDIETRYKDFNDAVEIIAKGGMKSAVIVDKTSDKIVEALKSRGFKKTAYNSEEYDYQKQLDPEFLPNEDSVFFTDMFTVITGGNLSERALYETLWKSNGKVIIFDKTAKNFLNSDLGQGLLKGALDTSGDGEISWLSKTNTGRKEVPKKQSGTTDEDYKELLISEGFRFEEDEDGKIDKKSISHPFDVPDKFQFKGRCIFVTDSYDDAPQPIQSRSMMADLTTNKEEFLHMIQKIAKESDKMGRQFSNNFPDVSKEEYVKAIEFFKKNKDKIHPKHFNSEGLEKYLSELKTSGEVNENSEKRLLRQLVKSEEIDLTNVIEVNISKAFSDILSW